MSSRNAYLSAEQRQTAPTIYRVITEVAEAAGRGAPVEAIVQGKSTLEAAGFKVDYLDVRDAETLEPVAADGLRPMRVLVAAWLGKTRLIDNIAVPAAG